METLRRIKKRREGTPLAAAQKIFHVKAVTVIFAQSAKQIISIKKEETWGGRPNGRREPKIYDILPCTRNIFMTVVINMKNSDEVLQYRAGFFGELKTTWLQLI